MSDQKHTAGIHHLGLTVPDIAMLWVVKAGTQTARAGGTTQSPSSVSTVITPSEAWMSCAES